MSKTEKQPTSTVQKLWHHRPQMESYKNNRPTTVLSTHISPTNDCNLTRRRHYNIIPLEVIDDYIRKLMSLGLKAVVITGEGDPLMYREINQLIIRLKHGYKLEVALITNGMLGARLNGRAWAALSWLQIRLNNLDDLEDRLHINLREIRPECTISGNIVYKGDNKEFSWLKSLRGLSDRVHLQYINVQPDYTLPTDKLLVKHKRITAMLRRLKDSRFLYKQQQQRAPGCSMCHKAYFQPYLSEHPDTDGNPGSVYPCTSLVEYNDKYRLCSAKDILLFLNHQILQPFDASADCTGCLSAEVVEMLEKFKNGRLKRFTEFEGINVKHLNFV